jgi:hypothetical protein
MLYEMSKVSHADLHASYREYVDDGYICVDQCRERSLFSPNLTIDQSEVGWWWVYILCWDSCVST